MKLLLLSEASTRRDFLRQMAGVARAAGSWQYNLGTLNHLYYANLPQEKRDAIQKAIFNMVNYESDKKGVIKLLRRRGVSEADVLGYIEYEAQSASNPTEFGESLLTGTRPEIFDVLQPGFTAKLMDIGIKKFGIEGMVGGIRDMSEEYDCAFIAWPAALLNPTLSNALGITSAEVNQMAKTGIGAAKLVRKGMMTRDDFISHRTWWQDEQSGKHQEQEREYQERLEKKKQEKEVQRWRPERSARPMHQSFESKLTRALSTVLECYSQFVSSSGSAVQFFAIDVF